MDSETAYYFYKEDFLSAYRNNGGDIKLSLYQVSALRDVEVEYLKTILKKVINEAKNRS